MSKPSGHPIGHGNLIDYVNICSVGKKRPELQAEHVFIEGDGRKTKRYYRRGFQFKELKVSICIVQPGFSWNKKTENQMSVLSASRSYLLETVQIDLLLYGSK